MLSESVIEKTIQFAFIRFGGAYYTRSTPLDKIMWTANTNILIACIIRWMLMTRPKITDCNKPDILNNR